MKLVLTKVVKPDKPWTFSPPGLVAPMKWGSSHVGGGDTGREVESPEKIGRLKGREEESSQEDPIMGALIPPSRNTAAWVVFFGPKGEPRYGKPDPTWTPPLSWG